MAERIGTATVTSSRGIPPLTNQGVARRKRPERSVVVPAGPDWSVTLTLPCRVVSEANKRGHWAKGQRRKLDQQQAVTLAWNLSPLRAWYAKHGLQVLTVTLKHHGPEMDGDNLQRAFKAVRDQIAYLLGVDDGDARVRWEYEQEPGEPRVTVTIRPGKEGADG
jgi:hypothetical protein